MLWFTLELLKVCDLNNDRPRPLHEIGHIKYTAYAHKFISTSSPTMGANNFVSPVFNVFDVLNDNFRDLRLSIV